MIKARKRNYYKNEVAKLTEAGAHTVPYETLRSIADTEQGPDRSIDQLSPGAQPSQIAEEAAKYFSSISQEFAPLDLTKIPTTYERPLPPLTVHEISERLKTMKKPES